MRIILFIGLLFGSYCHASHVKYTYYLTRSVDDPKDNCIRVSDDLSKCPSNDLNEASMGEPIGHWLDREIEKELDAIKLTDKCNIISDNIAYCPIKGEAP
jgi:hypothetical protein